MIGFLAIFLSLIVTGIAAFSFFNNHLAAVIRRDSSRRTFDGKLHYYLSVSLILAAAVYLLGLILFDQFQYAYVFAYSSKDLALAYKFSAFWAGQEGSFLLWVVFHGLFGILLVRRNTMPAGAKAVYSILQAVLLTILLAKSPFMMMSEVRGDGAGLNPLLQDPWMVIHPPVVFLGYAGLAIPFSYALGGLLASDHKNWIRPALAWALLSWAALGAGIFIGGYWAYKVLGWGGYWAWDPVENSSLIPWLVCGALVHLLLLSLRRPAAVKAAYPAAIFTFVLVLYGTFLTRSGILSNFSTHSFSDEGIGGLLAGLVMIISAAALVVLIIKWTDLPDGELYDQINSREFMTAAGAIAISGLAALVLIGTSTPLVTMLLGSPQNVNTSFYNSTSLPMAAIILLLLTLASILKWKGEEGVPIRRHWWIVLISHVVGLLSIVLGVSGILPGMVVGLACTALIGSLLAYHKGIHTSAVLTHAGVAIMIAGIIASSAGNRSVVASVEAGETKQLLGKNLTYTGSFLSADGKANIQNFTIDPGANLVQTITKLGKDGKSAVKEPAIYRGLFADLYIAPALNQEVTPGKEYILTRGEQFTDDGLTVRLIRYGMSGGDPQSMRAYALLDVSGEGKTEEVRPELVYENGHFRAIPTQALGKYQVALTALNTAEGKIKLEIDNPSKPPTGKIDVEVSHKPLINLVWLGTAIITIGTVWAGWRQLAITGIHHKAETGFAKGLSK